MSRAGILIALMLAGCAGEPPRAPAARPMRIVSLDYCADQYLLKLVPRDRILALSSDAEKDFSYLRAEARGLRKVAPRAEDVLVLRPDLVIRSYGGGPDAARFFADAGVPVVQLGYADDIAGVRAGLVEAARALGEPKRGEAVAAEMDRRLAAVRVRGDRGRAMYLTPGGVTTGEGTLIDALLRASGWRNFQTGPGWRPLPLERLTAERPDVIAAAFFSGEAAHPDPWSASRHPVARAALREVPVVGIEGAWTACGGWFVLDAVEALARGGEE